MCDEQVNIQNRVVEEMGTRFVAAWRIAEQVETLQQWVKQGIESGFEPHHGMEEIKAAGRRRVAKFRSS